MISTDFFCSNLGCYPVFFCFSCAGYLRFAIFELGTYHYSEKGVPQNSMIDIHYPLISQQNHWYSISRHSHMDSYAVDICWWFPLVTSIRWKLRQNRWFLRLESSIFHWLVVGWPCFKEKEYRKICRKLILDKNG